MKKLKLFEEFSDLFDDRDDYWDNYLDKLNDKLDKSRKDSEKNWDDYYKLIDNDEAFEYMEKMLDVTQEDFNLVKSILDSIGKYNIEIKKWGLLADDIEYDEAGLPKIEYRRYITASRQGFEYRVFRLPDEWFFVVMCDSAHFLLRKSSKILCDQIEGLEVFLKKMK